MIILSRGESKTNSALILFKNCSANQQAESTLQVCFVRTLSCTSLYLRKSRKPRKCWLARMAELRRTLNGCGRKTVTTGLGTGTSLRRMLRDCKPSSIWRTTLRRTTCFCCGTRVPRPSSWRVSTTRLTNSNSCPRSLTRYSPIILWKAKIFRRRMSSSESKSSNLRGCPK